MDVKIKDKAVKDLENLEKDIKSWILDKIGDLEDEPTKHDKAKIIRVGKSQVYRYKMKKERGDLDYRAIYDINQEENQIEIKAVFHRDQGYEKELISDRV